MNRSTGEIFPTGTENRINSCIQIVWINTYYFMPLLACIADDFTGATDLANTLVSEGMRVIQVFGVPSQAVELPDCDALIVALKSRYIPAEEAVALSLSALAWLKGHGCERFYSSIVLLSTPHRRVTLAP